MVRRLTVIAVAAAIFALLGTTAAMGHVRGLTVDRHAQLTAGGASVAVTGTMRCDAGEQGFVSVILSQNKGQTSVFGSGGTEVPCTGFSVGYSVTVHAIEEGTFTPGPAAALVQGSAFFCSQLSPEGFCEGESHFDDETVNEVVHLRR